MKLVCRIFTSSLAVFFLVLISSCNSETSKQPQNVEKPFVADTIFLDDHFGPFQDTLIPKVLRKLKICDVYVDTVEKWVLPCNPDLFRAFKLNNNATWEDGFMVDVKPGVIPGTTTRRFFVLRYDGQKYRIINDYMGSLLEMRTTKSGYNDLVLRYLDSRVGSVTILHRWNDSHGAYLPVEVLEINNHFVKPEAVDSLNNVYLKEFVWGY
jgi:hypothetical protein